MVEGALVVLARFQGDDRPAVGQGEDARLLAVEPFLKDQAVAGLAVDPPDHDLINRVERLAQVVADVDAFPGREAVGLEDHAEGPSQDVVAGLARRIEDPALTALLQFDLHARPELLARVHDPVDGFEGLGGGAAVQGVAEGRSPFGADDEGDLAREDVVLGVGGRSEDPVVGGRDSGLAHQLLGEDLAPFQFGGVAAGAEDPQPLALEGVDDPAGERVFRADDRQADSFALGELDQGPEVAGFDRDVVGVEGRPGVPRRAVDRVDAGRLLEFPAKGVFPPPLADDEDFQRGEPPIDASTSSGLPSFLF